MKQGRVIELTELSLANGALSFGSILSLPTAIEQMVPRLTAALDGDPATLRPCPSPPSRSRPPRHGPVRATP